MAIFGMSPWLWFCGITTRLAGNAVFWHAVVAGITICRRHRPDTITNGMLAPTGTSVMLKVPSTFDSVPTSGDPEHGVAGEFCGDAAEPEPGRHTEDCHRH